MNDPLAALRNRFLERTRVELAVLRLAGEDPAAAAAAIHRLSGAAGVFGFHEVSRLAAVVDDQIHAGQAPEPSDLAALIEAVERLPG